MAQGIEVETYTLVSGESQVIKLKCQENKKHLNISLSVKSTDFINIQKYLGSWDVYHVPGA